MNYIPKFRYFLVLSLFGISVVFAQTPPVESILLKNLTLIDGNGEVPREGVDILIRGNIIADIGANLGTQNTRIIDLTGKTVMPALISTHVHVGVIHGNEGGGKFYTRENIISQLRKYQDYGIGNILAMGTDRPLLFESRLRDSSIAGLLPGARMYSAGYGINVPDPSVNHESFLGNLYRPSSPTEIYGIMNQLAQLQPKMIKIWVDGVPQTKMKPEIYREIIQEAHKHNLRVSAHVYYLSDARKLVASGLDIFAHSVRDSLIDDDLVREIKAKNILYIPTLALDMFAHAYAGEPYWLNDDFFKRSLEPGVYEMISSERYRGEQKASAAVARSAAAFQIALKNVKKLQDAGVMIALGTDSGAFPIRAQGFAEHLELELLVRAGLSPLQAISAGTKNAAQLLNIDQAFGTIEKGKSADLIILGANPIEDIRNTRKIESVYKAGKEVSKGPH